MKKAVLAGLAYMFVADVYAFDLQLSHLTVKDGLPCSIIYSAMQDSQGFMWFCTETGVSRYDGKKFVNFTINKGLADNEIFKCFEDSRHRIWFLSYNGRVSYFSNGKIYNSNNLPTLSYTPTGAFMLRAAEDRYQQTWFSTSTGGVIRVTDSGITTFSPVWGEYHCGDDDISSVLFSHNGIAARFIVRPADRTIFLQHIEKGDTARALCQLHPLLSLTTANCDNSSRLFIHNGELMCCRNNKLFAFDLKKTGARSRLLTFLQDEQFLWLSFEKEGVLRVNLSTGNVNLRLLPGELITTMVKDYEKNVWFVSYSNGVFILKSNSHYVTNYSTGPTFGIANLRDASTEYVVSGNSAGQLHVITGGKPAHTFRLSPRKFNRILDIIPYGSGQVLIGSDDGVFHYDATTNAAPTRLSCIAGYKNYCANNDGSIWICSQDNIVKIVNNKCSSISKPAQLTRCTALAVLSDSVYYLGSTNKLHKVNRVSGNVDTILDDNLLQTQVSDLAMIEGQLWVATHGNGIFILKKDSIVRHILAEKEVLISDICERIHDDRERFVWISTNKGISVFDRIGAHLICNINSGAGIAADGVKNVVVNNGVTYVATSAGTSVFKLSDFVPTTRPPLVYVMSFNKGNETIMSPGDQVEFKYFKGFVTLSFAVIAYQESAGSIEYQYKFADEADWHRTPITDISFFSLSPGTHQLMFRAKRPSSNWSKPVTISMQVNPLWHQTVWFWSGLCMLTVLSGYCLVQMRLKAITRKAEENREHMHQIKELESKALVSQMNPHFIFNSLNTVQHLILSKNEQESLDFLADFAVLMRRMLELSRKQLISLAEEIDFLTRYMQLEATRFNHSFAFSMYIDDNLLQDEISIPPALLQPILENAIKHGVSPLGNEGSIMLTVHRETEFLVATVQDNGVGITARSADRETNYKKRESTGLKVLNERLNLMRTRGGARSTITIVDLASEHNGEHGTRVELKIPIQR